MARTITEVYFSKPIKLILDIGIIMFTTSLLFLIYFIALWCLGKTVEGWATIVVSIWMLGGVQLLCLGVIGEYIGKIYIETKKRPKFIIDKLWEADTEEEINFVNPGKEGQKVILKIPTDVKEGWILRRKK